LFLFITFVVPRLVMMTGVVRDWRIEFMKAHPRLFPVSPGSSCAAQGYPETGEGWRDLLDRACVRIEAALADGDLFTAEQIKSKYGTLRFYWGGRLAQSTTAQVEEAIELAEARSACTCEVCGEEGRLYSRGDWLATACPRHAEGEPALVKAGRENLRIVGRLVEDRIRIVSCRRYDRETDSFADVDPGALGIEED
jgi:hypothetical protein